MPGLFLQSLWKNPNYSRFSKLQGGLLHLEMNNRGVILFLLTIIPDKLKEAQSVLLEINSYAKRAPVLICAFAKKNYSDNGNYNILHFHDLGAANENMFLESFNQGLIMHEMGGFNRDKANELFNIPEDCQMGIMIAIGYQDSHELLPGKYKEKALLPRERKPLSEIVFLEEINRKLNL